MAGHLPCGGVSYLFHWHNTKWTDAGGESHIAIIDGILETGWTDSQAFCCELSDMEQIFNKHWLNQWMSGYKPLEAGISLI